MDQEVIDSNAEQLMDKRVFSYPKSRQNIGQVIIPRLETINNGLEHYKHPIPRTDDILRRAIKFKFFSEMDLDSGYHQFKISKNLSDIFTFTCSKGKVSMGVLPFGVYWAG